MTKVSYSLYLFILDMHEEEDVNIVSENQAQKRRRMENLESTFGTGKQPTLEKLEYTVGFKVSD